MSSRSSILKTAPLLGLLLTGLTVVAAEKAGVEAENPFGAPATNSFYTNSSGRRQDRLQDRPREFGIFSPLRTQVPKSFGDSGNNPGAGLAPIIRPAVTPPKDEEDKGKGWIFAKPEDFSAEKIFKVKNFGMKEKENDKETKSQSGFAKYIAEESSKSEKMALNAENARAAKADSEKYDVKATGEDRTDKSSQSDTLRDFTSRNPSRDTEAGGDRTSSISTRTSIFGEFFRGNHVAEERWAEQSAARRNEFEQLFNSRPSADLTRSLTPATPTVTTIAPTDFNRSTVNSTSDQWKNDSRPFSSRSFDDGGTSRLPGVSSSSSFATPTATRQQYQPAVLPFPKRPGELFK